jgi:uncharacterized protein
MAGRLIVYLVDTNVWLERFLEQTRADEVGQFLESISSENLYITDFGFHSIGIIMSRLNRESELLRFVQDAFLDGAVSLIHLDPGDTHELVRVMEQFNLDFDDAYHYVAARKYNLILVSFDSDFDRTPFGKKEPRDFL